MRTRDRKLLPAALLLLAVLAPFELGDGRVNGPLVVTALICFAWFARMILTRHVVLDGSRVVVAALAFMAAAALSFAVGQYPWFELDPAPMPAQVGGLAVFLLSGLLFLSMGHLVTSVATLQSLTWLFIGAGALQVVVMVFPFTFDFRASSLALTNYRTVGSLFWVWLVALSAGQAIFNITLSPAKRFACLAVATAAMAWALLAVFDWASGWLPSFVALSIVLLLRFPRATMCAGLLAVVPAVLVSGTAWGTVMEAESWSWMTRLEAWTSMMQLIEHNPWLGFGPANYPFYTPLFPILGYRAQFNSHNNYIDLLAQTGAIGLLAFCWFAVEAVLLAWALYRRAPAGFQRAYVASAVGGLIGSLVAGFLADWIIPFTYNVGLPGFRSSLLFWFFVGGLLALRRIQAYVPAPARVVRQGVGGLVTARALR